MCRRVAERAARKGWGMETFSLLFVEVVVGHFSLARGCVQLASRDTQHSQQNANKVLI
jgi:hypothetical protein